MQIPLVPRTMVAGAMLVPATVTAGFCCRGPTCT